MTLTTLIIIGAILVVGSALQSAGGFAFGMFAIPLLIMVAGIDPTEAIVILVVCNILQTSIGVWHLRKEIMWNQVWWMALLAGCMIPLGVYALHAAESLSRDSVRQIFGCIILCAVGVQWFWKIKPRDHIPWPWGFGAVSLSGFMAGLAGMGGPPLVMWVMAHTWSNKRSRATMWVVFLSMAPWQVLFHYQNFGKIVLEAAGTGALFAPFCLLGMIPGLWIGHRLTKPQLRIMSFIVLTIVGTAALVLPMVGM